MLFKYISEAEFLTFLKSCQLKGSYFNKKIKYILKIPNQVYYKVSMSMKNSMSDLFCPIRKTRCAFPKFI